MKSFPRSLSPLKKSGDKSPHSKVADACGWALSRQYDAQARQLERELPGLRRQVAELERQEAEIREKMLVP